MEEYVTLNTVFENAGSLVMIAMTLFLTVIQ